MQVFMNSSYFFVFVVSFLTTASIIFSSIKFGLFLNRRDLRGVQKVHTEVVPRVGGIAIFVSFSLSIFNVDYFSNELFIFWISLLPILLSGVFEDLTLNVTPLQRIIFIFMSILVVYFFNKVGIKGLEFSWVDSLLFSNDFFVLFWFIPELCG